MDKKKLDTDIEKLVEITLAPLIESVKKSARICVDRGICPKSEVNRLNSMMMDSFNNVWDMFVQQSGLHLVSIDEMASSHTSWLRKFYSDEEDISKE